MDSGAKWKGCVGGSKDKVKSTNQLKSRNVQQGLVVVVVCAMKN
jgi:hypothetical protein